jgi:transcriptional regulator with XRE-family HTH domain
MNAAQLVAHNLRRMRVEKGISQESLAVDAGIDRTYVSRLERCMENPSVNVLERLAVALGREIVEFFVRPEPDAAMPAVLPSGRKPKSGG